MKLWEIYSFVKAKEDIEVLILGSKSSKLSNNGKDNRKNKDKSVIYNNVGNEFYL